MDYKLISRAAPILQQIKELDEYMASMRRLAKRAVNDKTRVILRLKIEDLDKQPPPGDHYSDAMASLFTHHFGGMAFQMAPSTAAPEFESVHDEEIDNSTLLRLIALLVAERQAKKELLLQQLQQLGVAV